MARVVVVPVGGALLGRRGSRGCGWFGKTVVCRMVLQLCPMPGRLHMGGCVLALPRGFSSSVWVQMPRRMRLSDMAACCRNVVVMAQARTM